MSEAEWWAGRLPHELIAVLQARLSDSATSRQLRLCVIGCCRQLATDDASDMLSRQIDLAERFADGEATLAEMNGARAAARAERHARRMVDSYRGQPDPLSLLESCVVSKKSRLWDTVREVAGLVVRVRTERATGTKSRPGVDAEWFRCRDAERALLCETVRGIFGNPFRPAAFDPRWRTSDTEGIARGMYDSRDFSPMPILADALMDAGCDADDILAHCRTGGPHVRGCRVVDLVLGKE